MLTEERLSEIRALTWEWQYENCSDHQAAVDDLLRERDALAAEVERLREALAQGQKQARELAEAVLTKHRQWGGDECEHADWWCEFVRLARAILEAAE